MQKANRVIDAAPGAWNGSCAWPRHAFQRVQVVLLWVACLGLSHCGFQLHSATHLPDSLRTVALQSSDPYGPLARAVHAQLRRHGFIVVDSSEHPILQLQLLNTSEERTLRSVFADGSGAQYQIIYRMTAQLHWTQQARSALKKIPAVPAEAVHSFPLAAAVTHTFFDNPQTALAKSVEQEIVQQQLYQQAADQLALQLLLLLSKGEFPLPTSRLPTAPPVTEDATPEP